MRVGDSEHIGEVVLADKWSADMGLGPDGAGPEFRIVVLSTPARVTARSIRDPAVAVWLPSPVIAEGPAAYVAGASAAGLVALRKSKSYQQGRVYTNRGLVFRPGGEFPIGGGPLTIESLGAYLLLDRADDYVRMLDHDLPSLLNIRALGSNLREFRLFQERFRRGLQRTRTELSGLSLDLDSPLPEGDQRAQDNLLRLAGIGEPVAFATVAGQIYGGPAGLADDLETYRRLGRLARLGPEVRSVAHYLDGVSLRASDDELAVDAISVQEQLQLGALAARPEVWDSILDMFRWIKARYTSLYLQHHRDYFRDLEGCYQALNSAALQVDAVTKLREISQLDVPSARDLPSQYQDMLTRARPCEVRELQEEAIAARPTCAGCGLRLSTDPPVREAREYLARLRATLEEQCRRLSVVISAHILGDRSNDKLDTLVRIVQVSDLTSLANVLDDELVQLLADLLREGSA